MHLLDAFETAFGTSFETLRGLTLESIERVPTDEGLLFRSQDGRRFRMSHFQQCCESVRIEDIVGDLDDLIGSPIVRAEKRSEPGDDTYGSLAWTFYELATNKGSVTIRWCGSAHNHYYSVGVSFREESSKEDDLDFEIDDESTGAG